MLNTLRIHPRRLYADADRAEKQFHDLMPLATDARQFLAGTRQENTPIRALLDITFSNQPLQHLGDRRLRNAQALGNIHLPRLAAVGEKVGDELDVIFHEFAAAVVPRLPEAFHLGVGCDKRSLNFDRLTKLLVQFNSACS